MISYIANGSGSALLSAFSTRTHTFFPSALCPDRFNLMNEVCAVTRVREGQQHSRNPTVKGNTTQGSGWTIAGKKVT